MDWEIEKAYSFDAGKKEGVQQKAVEDATNMLKKKYSTSDISEITGLPLEQVLELQKQITVQAQVARQCFSQHCGLRGSRAIGLC